MNENPESLYGERIKPLEWKLGSLLNDEDKKAFFNQFVPYFWVLSSQQEAYEPSGTRLYSDFTVDFTGEEDNLIARLNPSSKEHNTLKGVTIKNRYKEDNLPILHPHNKEIYISPGDQIGVDEPILSFSSISKGERIELPIYEGLPFLLDDETCRDHLGEKFVPILTLESVCSYTQNYLPAIKLYNLRVDRLDLSSLQAGDIKKKISDNFNKLQNELARNLRL